MKKVEDLFKARASKPLETAILFDGRFSSILQKKFNAR